MFLANDIWSRTAWHVAAVKDKLQELRKLWEWAKEILTPQELNNKFLLDKDDREYTTWHVATFTGNTEVFEELVIEIVGVG
jgi:hypothetical protein